MATKKKKVEKKAATFTGGELAARITKAFGIEYAARTFLKPAPYNPRNTTDAQLVGICRSIVEFGIVDPFIARREDGLIVGGHQRYKAVEKLLSGPFKYKGPDGKFITVKWELPDDKLPVVFVDGLTDERTKLLNLSLNKVTGDWEHDGLASLIKELADKMPIEDLLVTGFTSAEITDYVDLAGEGTNFNSNGDMPKPTTKSPKLDLDFSSPGLRDAVKSAIAEVTKEGELGGDALARALGVKKRRTRAAA